MTGLSKVLIIGGGVGGLATAIALHQRGITVDIVEIQPSWAISGVGIIQPNNALRALDRIGLAQACVDHGAPFFGWHFHNADGQIFMSSPAPNDAAPAFPPINGITRPALHSILANAAIDAGVAIRMGITVDSWHEQDSHIDVRFSDESGDRYDLIIGADGIHSATRRKLFGSSHRPRFLGEGIWRYNLPRPADMDWGGIFFGPRSKAGLVPLTASTMYMFLVSPEQDEQRQDGPDSADQMRARLAGHGGLIAELRDLIIDPACVVYRPAHRLMMPRPWMKGRFVIIGDAAHASPPHLAQGAAMAIEDGVLLAELLAGDAPLHIALDAFMTRRFERTQMVVDVSTRTAAWETDEWAGQPDPAADPGGALHHATLALMEDY